MNIRTFFNFMVIMSSLSFQIFSMDNNYASPKNFFVVANSRFSSTGQTENIDGQDVLVYSEVILPVTKIKNRRETVVIRSIQLQSQKQLSLEADDKENVIMFLKQPALTATALNTANSSLHSSSKESNKVNKGHRSCRCNIL